MAKTWTNYDNMLRGGRLVTVVGTIAEIKNIESVRNACEVVYSGKGGLGKSVIQVSKTENSP